MPLTSCSWVSGARRLGCGTEVAQRGPALPTMRGNGGSGCFTVGPACPAGAGTARAFCKWCLVGTNLSTCLGVRLWDKTPRTACPTSSPSHGVGSAPPFLLDPRLFG